MTIEIDYERLKQENARLWKENSQLRPLVSDLEHKLAVAIRHLKKQAMDETDIITKREEHG